MKSEVSNQETDVLHSVRSFSVTHPAFSEDSIRWLVFRFKEKLLAEKAIAFTGKKLVIFGNRFIEVIKEGGLVA
jgi:hypothetical protein